MAEILNNIKIWWYDRQLVSLQNKQAFYQEFLPFQKRITEEKTQHKLALLELKYKQKILPYEIKAGIKSAFLDLEYDTLKQRLEERYSLKQRALTQRLKRKGIDDVSAIENLKQEKAKQLSLLKQHLYIETPANEDIALYESKKTAFDQIYQAKKAHLLEIKKQKNEALEKKTKEKINDLKQKIEGSSKRLNQLIETRKVKQSLPEGVILKIDNLSMHFGGLKAVDELSFEVKQGEVFGLIGPNGAGKTTVFNCITRFYQPTDGEMFFVNHLGDTVHLNDIVVHNIIKEGIVRTFQNVEMIWELNVIENLLVAAHTHYRSGFFGHLFNSRQLRQEEVVMRKKALNILEDMDLLDYAYSYPYGLPYGILKRIELARTLMVKPKLIILDEPAAGLNDAETEELAKTIKQIQAKYQATIFLVEHDMGLVMDICDTVCAISFGKKLAIGTPKEIQTNKLVQEAYLGGE